MFAGLRVNLALVSFCQKRHCRFCFSHARESGHPVELTRLLEQSQQWDGARAMASHKEQNGASPCFNASSSARGIRIF